MTDAIFIREPGVEDCEHLEVCEHACRMWCRSYKPRVDRDALMKLAKNLDAQAECRIKSNDIITRRGDRSRNMAVAKDFFGIAREIRNALGVDDGA